LSARAAPDAAALERVRRVLERDYMRRLPLAALARVAACSPFQLLRAFRRRHGVTPHVYQEQLRLEAAGALLANHARTITAIALELGYAHHSHFTAAFRRRFGVTPRAFRRRQTTGASR